MAHKQLMGEKEAKQALEAAGLTGFDWDSLDAETIAVIIRAIISLFTRRKPVMGAGHEHDNEMLKAHFDAIAALAACGSQCCEA